MGQNQDEEGNFPPQSSTGIGWLRLGVYLTFACNRVFYLDQENGDRIELAVIGRFGIQKVARRYVGMEKFWDFGLVVRGRF